MQILTIRVDLVVASFVVVLVSDGLCELPHLVTPTSILSLSYVVIVYVLIDINVLKFYEDYFSWRNIFIVFWDVKTYDLDIIGIKIVYVVNSARVFIIHLDIFFGAVFIEAWFRFDFVGFVNCLYWYLKVHNIH